MPNFDIKIELSTFKQFVYEQRDCAGALRLLEEHDRLCQVKLAKLQQHRAIGIEQAEQGELIDDNGVFTELEDDRRRTALELAWFAVALFS